MSRERSDGQSEAPEHGVGYLRGVVEAMGFSLLERTPPLSLSDGISGARTYRVSLPTGPAVLKIAWKLPAEPRQFEGARRELRFYRDISPEIPQHVPAVLGSLEDHSVIALLLAHYPPSDSASQWRDSDFIRIANELGAFHGQWWTGTPALDRWRWLRVQLRSVDTADAVAAAANAWDFLAAEPRLSGLMPRTRLEGIYRGLAQIGEIQTMRGGIARTLCHGDFHVANLLKGDQGEMLWIDWQEICIGFGTDDLAQLISRAWADGAPVPHNRTMRAYHHAVRQSVEIRYEEVRMSIEASELVKTLIDWPHYLQNVSTNVVERILSRARDLARALRLT